jgi:hypothetical protein
MSAMTTKERDTSFECRSCTDRTGERDTVISGEARKETGLAGTTRMEGLCDGTFAIIVITLLVIEIHRRNAVPEKLTEEPPKEWWL